MSTYDVQFWAIKHRADRRKPYQVRWVVAGRQFAESFMNKALADSFRSGLMKAARSGEPFDEVSGRPESQARDVAWFDHAREYVARKWPRAAAKTRKSMAEAMTTVTMAMFGTRHGRPDDQLLRQALCVWAFNPSRDLDEAPAEVRDALAWAAKASRKVSVLRDTEQVRRVLDALTVLLDGKPAAATTVYRKRAVFYNALGFAVERKLLPANPIDQVQWTAPEVADAIDRRVVVGPELARKLIAAVSDTGRRGDHLRVFFACLYFAGLRPSEAIALRVDNCELPETGWGRLVLTGSEPRAGADWTDDGNPREARELKRRGTAATRVVPIPSELVAILREHIAACGIGTQARLFRSESGGSLHETSYYGAWRKARAAVLTVAQQRSPLARRPYDLRHAAASLWLNAGVAPTEVARRLGHSVAMLFKVYANCLDTDEGVANDRIASALDGVPGSGKLGGTPDDDERLSSEVCGPDADQDGVDDLDSR